MNTNLIYYSQNLSILDLVFVILGPDKTNIPFKYQKQIRDKVYSTLLINNNKFHNNNNNTDLPIYNVLTDMLDSPMYLPFKPSTTICTYVTTLGVISIETSPTSKNDGKHYCIIPQTQWNKIQCAIEKTLDEKLSYIGVGNFVEQFKATFGVHPFCQECSKPHRHSLPDVWQNQIFYHYDWCLTEPQRSCYQCWWLHNNRILPQERQAQVLCCK